MVGKLFQKMCHATIHITKNSWFLFSGSNRGGLPYKRPAMLMTHLLEGRGKKNLLCSFTKRIQKWKGGIKKSVVFVWWRCPLNIIYTELSIQHFDVTFCVFSLVESSWASSRTVWSCRQEKLPPPSIPLGGRHATLGRLHRHSFFIYAAVLWDSYRVLFEECRLTSWISEKN